MRKYEDQNVILYIENGILYSIYKEGCIVTKEVSNRVISERIRLSKGVSYPVIADIQGVKYWTMGSRNSDMKEDAYKLISCAAIVIKSKLIRITWDFTVRLFPMPVPNKIFNEIEEARKWIVSIEVK